MDILLNNFKEIEIPVWWKCGNRMYRRDALPTNHPEYTYNYVKNVIGVIPEDYGILHPIMSKYNDLNKEELLIEISKLHDEISNYKNY